MDELKLYDDNVTVAKIVNLFVDIAKLRTYITNDNSNY